MKIEFIPSSKDAELTIDMPEPAKNFIPDWYKSQPRFLNSEKPEILNGRVVNNSIKSCMPFYDAMTSGYIQKTWCDIHINFNGQNFEYSNSRSPEIISHRETSSVNISDCFYPVEFIWKMHWIPKLPNGWSLLVTNPFNRIDLPFYSLSGIIDSDSFYHSMPGNYPFYIRKGFSGIIPRGTPMYQITPIKRENWKSSSLLLSEDERNKLISSRNSYFFGFYKRFFHNKKSFK